MGGALGSRDCGGEDNRRSMSLYACDRLGILYSLCVASQIVSKLRSLTTLAVAGISANPALGTESFRVDGATGATCVVVEVSPTGIVFECNGGPARSRRIPAPKGLCFAGLALMMNQAANGLLF